jgi:hypothetical protein
MPALPPFQLSLPGAHDMPPAIQSWAGEDGRLSRRRNVPAAPIPCCSAQSMSPDFLTTTTFVFLVQLIVDSLLSERTG